jgi:hypothetical protein
MGQHMQPDIKAIQQMEQSFYRSYRRGVRIKKQGAVEG